MKKEYDFSKGQRGRFYRPNVELNIPACLESDVAKVVQVLDAPEEDPAGGGIQRRHAPGDRGLFRVLDRREPSDWVTEMGEDGERYAYPAALNDPGFFEDFFEDKPKAVRTLWHVVNRRLATVADVA